MSSPLHKYEGPQWKTFWRRFCPGTQTRGGFEGSYRQIFFVPPNFVVLRKICVKRLKKTNLSPLKTCFTAPNLKTWLRAWFCQKWCLQLGYFVLKTIRPQDVAYHQIFFYTSPLGCPCKHFFGGAQLGCYSTGRHCVHSIALRPFGKIGSKLCCILWRPCPLATPMV